MGRDENAEGTNPDRREGSWERPGALEDDELLRKDTAYSPASENETAAKQSDPVPELVDDDIDTSQINAVPGTGGPDDAGDVEVDPDDLNLPFRDS